MPIVVNCKCGKRHELGDDLADATMYCDQCGAMVSLPAPPRLPEWDVPSLSPQLIPFRGRPGKYVRRTIATNFIIAVVLMVFSLISLGSTESAGERWETVSFTIALAFASVALGIWWRLLRRAPALRGRVAVAFGTFFFLFGVLMLAGGVMATVGPVGDVGDERLSYSWFLIAFLSMPIAAHVVAAYYLTFRSLGGTVVVRDEATATDPPDTLDGLS